MKLTVLVDNQTVIDRYFRGEPGVSYWIEVDHRRFLFDTGYSDLVIQNGLKMKIPVEQADGVLLSHGHNDHTWGLEFLAQSLSEHQAEFSETRKPPLYCHPDALLPKRYGELPIGIRMGEQALNQCFDLKPSRNRICLTETLTWLGEIPRVHLFEPARAIGETLRDGNWEPDYLNDDTALVWNGPKGLVIVTGCSHSGICNIISYAQQVTGVQKVDAVIGGFHLLDYPSEKASKTVEFFKQVGVRKSYAGHCTGFEARCALAGAMPHSEIGCGVVIDFKEE